MGELLLYEKGQLDRYYVKLTVEYPEDDVVPAIDVISLSVIESMRTSSPYLNVRFVDRTGSLLHRHPIVPNAEFVLTFGPNAQDSVQGRFKLSNMKLEVTNPNDLDRLIVSSDLIMSGWENMFKRRRSRSWSDVRYSDVVSSLASEIGFNTAEIEPTKGRFDVIQPYWSNAQLLKWLSGNSVNSSGVGGYQFSITYDGQFRFQTFDRIYNQKPKKELTYDASGRRDDGFYGLSVNNSYMPTLNHGGFGVNYSYFDYDRKEFVKADRTVKDIPERQLSDWYYVADEHVEGSTQLFGGRDTNTRDVTDNRILGAVNSVHQIEVSTAGDTDYHAGDIIKLVVPVPTSNNEGLMINELYSGNWMVWKVVHFFDIKKARYNARLYLTRNGLNGIDVDGLVKTSVGKSVS